MTDLMVNDAQSSDQGPEEGTLYAFGEKGRVEVPNEISIL